MAKIILQNKEYSLYDFENEAEFEKAVIENQKFLFGKNSIYIDVKKRIGQASHRGIPDAFLIDFYNIKNPQLYIVENEIASHNVYSNITEQIARFGVSIVSSANQIRNILIKAIQVFPASIVAKIFSFKQSEFFGADENEKGTVEVSL